MGTQSRTDKFLFILIILLLFSLNFSIAVCNIIFFLVILISGYEIARNRLKIITPPFFKYLLLFILLTIVSTIFSINFSISIVDNKELFIYLLIPILPVILNSKKKIEISIYSILFSAAISAFVGIIISLFSGISLNNRLKGFTSHWMTYAGLLMLVFVFFIIFNKFSNKGKKKLFFYLILGMILIAIIFSLTRSAWVGIFISISLFLLTYFKKRPLVLILPALFLIILFILLPVSIKKRVTSIIDINNITNLDRIHMAYSALEIIKDYPLTGVGPDNIKYIYPKYRHPDTKKNNPHLHNNFLQIAAEKGIFSLILFLIFIVSVYRSLFKFMKSEDQFKKNISTAVFFMFTAFLIAGMFEYNYGDSEIKFLLFYFLTLPFLPTQESDTK